MTVVTAPTMDLAAVRVLVEGLDHPEGVAVGPDGTLWAGGEAGQLYRIDPGTGTFTQVADTGGFLLGVTVDGDGHVIVCDVGRREVLRIDPETGAVAVVTAGAPGRELVNPNWSVFDAHGNLYVTDSGHWGEVDGCVLVVRPDGSTEVLTDEVAAFPNGACLTADGDALLVLESIPPALVRVPLRDGTAGARELVAALPGTVPDGVCLDTGGRAYVCCYRPDTILVVAPDGTVTTLLDDPLGTTLAAPTNAVWFGEDRTTLVTGNLGRWHLAAFEPGARGVPLVYPEGPT